MLSNILDRISFWSLYLVIVLLPVFFLPFTRIPVESSKTLLVVLGLSVSLIFWAAARFSDGKIFFPKSYVPLSLGALALVFLISASLSSASQVSFFGVMLDGGTFWFMFAGFLMMLLSALVLREKSYARKVLKGLLVTSLVVFVFQILRFIMPEALSLGVFGGRTSNLLGSWNTLGVFAGLMAVLGLFAFEFLELKKKQKFWLSLFVVFCLLMAAMVNFLLVWEFLGVFALLIFVYRISISSIGRGEDGPKAPFPGLSFAVVMVSLLFFMSGQFIGQILPEKLGIAEIEIGPSFGATISATGQSLKEDPLFGIGPNRFSEVWAMHKPQVINFTAFWDTSFNSGSGFFPTLVATTGIFGFLAVLAFLGTFLFAGVKTLLESMKKREGNEGTLFFVLALYLLLVSVFYSSGVVLIMLAFAFVGIFVGLQMEAKEHGKISFSFLNDPRRSFFSILALVLIMVVSAGLTFKFVERFVSLYHFEQAFFASDVSKAERSIVRAISLYPNDLYYRTYGNIHLLKINNLVSKEEELTDVERGDLQNSLTETVSGATLATNYNPFNYINHQTLGSIQSSLGYLGAEGAYSASIEAYKKAVELNPLNPGLHLSIATGYLAEKKQDEARTSALKALEIKPNYADAMVVLSRIEKESGNNSKAIEYAEGALLLFPQDEALKNYVNSLKTGGSATPPEKLEDVEN